MILLDTHVLLWLATDESKLSRAARRALKAPRLLADISLREIAALQRAGRIEVDGSLAEWLNDALTQLKVEVVPIDARIAARSVRIVEHFHGDPADQLIAATAIELDVPLVTADELLRASPAVQTIW
jgi:PIN domain nuclease of toxin-antitoxin system